MTMSALPTLLCMVVDETIDTLIHRFGRPALRAGHLRLLLLPPLPLDLAEELDLRPEWPGSAEYDIGEEFDLAA